MDGPLSEREQRVLDDMERELSGGRAQRRRTAAAGPRLLVLLALGSLGLLVAAAVTGEAALIGAFAVCWPLTVAAGFRLLYLLYRRSPGHSGTGGPPQPFV
ncbi:hypothetical protein [Streptomyces yaizuensis]|uniref:DUF3040 domain-containing protein n=1 Tax=Streptomyces yaizuensis TaxID=2989713 RepID=A0ABQ5NYJ4_9ACTN|nr:hypothetical protein [Streptomyces sp. YSPA8]GLF95442.1 DUF3040 domain-containing protein [Streptomyces sp. YSPA8]